MQHVYFKAECHAQMKLRVSYVVDVCVEKTGVVNACQCECGAGMGPSAHCKHVIAVLYGITKFCTSGEFITFQTCTQTLQTFHQTKRHTGSPVKVTNLTVKANYNIDYDPRPSKLIKQDGYGSYFKNILINSGVMHQAPITQILEPANPLGVLLDHSYNSSGDPIESYLRSAKISEITRAEVDALQHATIGQSTNSTWKAERMKRINSSQFGRICKMTGKTNGSAFATSMLIADQQRAELSISQPRKNVRVSGNKAIQGYNRQKNYLLWTIRLY
jgi:hypothetical protein